MGTHQIRRRRRAARSLTSQGRAEPLCARIGSANREISEGNLISDHGNVSSYEGHMERRTGKICGACSRVRIFVETSKPRPTRARLGNEELADEAELVSLSVG